MTFKKRHGWRKFMEKNSQKRHEELRNKMFRKEKMTIQEWVEMLKKKGKDDGRSDYCN